MTILGVFLSQYIPNKNLNDTIPKMINLGIDVNLGINKKNNENNLMMAFENNKPSISDETINMMIANSTLETINYSQGDGAVLHHAIYRPNRLACIKKLLDTGASLKTISRFGRTPLMAAVSNDHLDAVKLILEHNLETLDYQDKNGNTALMLAIKCLGIQRNTLAIIDMLILAGANIHLTNNDGKMAKQLASWNKLIEEQVDSSVEQLGGKSGYVCK